MSPEEIPGKEARSSYGSLMTGKPFEVISNYVLEMWPKS